MGLVDVGEDRPQESQDVTRKMAAREMSEHLHPSEQDDIIRSI